VTLGTTASNSNAATLAFSQSFTGNGTLPAAASVANVTGIDGSSNVKTNGINLSVATGTSSSPSYDLNGNMASDGTNSYAWDAENRLIEIVYPGSGNNSQFAYDGRGRCVEILEFTASSLTSTKQFVCGGDALRPNQPWEERDSSGVITKQFFSRGQINATTKYSYVKDQLGSMREMTNAAGVIESESSYDPFGQMTLITNTVPSDFGFTGHYIHARSGLSLTPLRAYSPMLDRWLTRDPIQENGPAGVNLFAYVGNNPISMLDATGAFRTNDDGSVGMPPLGPPPQCPDSCWNNPAPPSGPNSPCLKYGAQYFLGVSEACVCTCMGNNDWANNVRGCLWCERTKHNQSDDMARHIICVGHHFDAAGYAGLGACAASCAVAPPAY
jgi:RHS repeat-associated protein